MSKYLKAFLLPLIFLTMSLTLWSMHDQICFRDYIYREVRIYTALKESTFNTSRIRFIKLPSLLGWQYVVDENVYVNGVKVGVEDHEGYIRPKPRIFHLRRGERIILVYEVRVKVLRNIYPFTFRCYYTRKVSLENIGLSYVESLDEDSLNDILDVAHYIVKKVRYKETPGIQSPKVTLKLGEGDCLDQALLLAYLCKHRKNRVYIALCLKHDPKFNLLEIYSDNMTSLRLVKCRFHAFNLILNNNDFLIPLDLTYHAEGELSLIKGSGIVLDDSLIVYAISDMNQIEQYVFFNVFEEHPSHFKVKVTISLAEYNALNKPSS